MMPKRFIFLSIILVSPILLFSQQLQVKGSSDNLYLDHNVAAKENFYSISRLYNVSPRDLAAYNHLSMENGLNIGQQLKIPLTPDNFTQKSVKSAAEALVPLYHTVRAGETLFRLGANYRNVPLENIRNWNNLSGDNVQEGAPMIIGFLRVSKAESALASNDFTGAQPGLSTATATVESRVEETATARPETSRTPATPTTTTTATTTTPTPVVRNSSNENKSGFFAQEWNQNAKANASVKNGAAAVFKSTSGWQDGKYYCFNNDAAPGSIVRISTPGGSNAVYAKVLDAIPDIKQNEGLALVLSNAAADALGISGDKFEAVIQYTR